ncbi:hypothetical protein PLEOSDRAFT_1088853 [Pleurotus ostreatus PC15]|uniref:Uncharacterized protein n=1 Tax=Pleurotus ostreatus (strain PC15) TaxID=1137138 RepID=A0A067NX22_PLEO1|nr:hypothetical protein PLEOSDRAFT_1088853 [Pleurotus ostreatus PC15]
MLECQVVPPSVQPDIMKSTSRIFSFNNGANPIFSFANSRAWSTHSNSGSLEPTHDVIFKLMPFSPPSS